MSVARAAFFTRFAAHGTIYVIRCARFVSHLSHVSFNSSHRNLPCKCARSKCATRYVYRKKCVSARRCQPQFIKTEKKLAVLKTKRNNKKLEMNIFRLFTCKNAPCLRSRWRITIKRNRNVEKYLWKYGNKVKTILCFIHEKLPMRAHVLYSALETCDDGKKTAKTKKNLIKI